MKLFLIAGKGRNGKHTVAKVIKEFYDKLGEKTVITTYSKYIKLYAREMTTWDGSDDSKPRSLLQKIGTKIRIDIREDFFTHRLMEDIEFYKCFFDNIIIADVRLPFEVEHMREKYSDLYAIRVNRDVETNLTEEEKSHETEKAMDNYNRFDYELKNKDLETLKEDVYSILDGIE